MRLLETLSRIGRATRDNVAVILTSPIIHHAALMIAAFWCVALFVPAYLLIQMMNYVVIAVAIAVITSFLPNVLMALRRGYPLDRVAQLTLGICLAWASSTCFRIWSAVSRATEYEWMRYSAWIAFFLFLSACAGILHITAPGAIDGHVPQRNWIIVGIAIGVGCLIAGILIGMQVERPPF